jgi:sugar phosphate isomerase/epimerase
MRLGMVTYQMGQDMDLERLITFCETVGLGGVELRTTHAHGVEPSLSAQERDAVRDRFAGTPVELVGLGTVCEFHTTDAAELQRNIEDAKAFSQLAADVGAGGIKVRPNGLPEGIVTEKTCEQIGRSWAEAARFAADLGVEVRMEVHGRDTQQPEVFSRILAHAAHPNAKVCWNSNRADMDPETGSVASFFEAVGDRIGLVHITEIGVPGYPWRELFGLLRASGYAGFCLAEIGANPEPERFMRYYKTVYDCLAQP